MQIPILYSRSNKSSQLHNPFEYVSPEMIWLLYTGLLKLTTIIQYIYIIISYIRVTEHLIGKRKSF
jgi:hypothetical protein